MLTKKGFKKKTICVAVLTSLGINCLLLANSLRRTGCPVETSSEFKITLDNRIFIKTGQHLIEYTTHSKTCLQCHDGTIARDIPFNDHQTSRMLELQGIQNYPQMTGKNHPVNVPYPVSDSNFVNKEKLDHRLILTDGEVTCYTCHSGSHGDPRLSIPNNGSRLCLACHIK